MRATLWDDIRQSVYNTFDHNLLENGAYINITGGQKNARGDDLSTLYPVIDNELYSTSGYIWQSAFPNWVYESGVVNMPSPIVASGVIVNGVFQPKSNTLHIDYVNGRIITDLPFNTTDTVQAAFSHKEYSFLKPNNNNPFVNQIKYTTNDKVTKSPIPATSDTVYLPAIFIEFDYGTDRDFQLGGVLETLPILRLSIISDNQSQIEGIASLLCKTSTKGMPIVALGLGPKFDSFNDLLQNYSYYNWVKLTQNYSWIKSVKYDRFHDATAQQHEPSLFGGVVTVEISAIR